MTKKQTLFLVLTALLLFAIFYLWPMYRYSKALDKQADEWYQDEYVNKSFFGRVYSINEYNYDPHRIVLTIDDTTEFHLSYGVTCVDNDFTSFVSEGDSAYKKAGSKFITFVKSQGQRKEFELNFCDKFK